MGGRGRTAAAATAAAGAATATAAAATAAAAAATAHGAGGTRWEKARPRPLEERSSTRRRLQARREEVRLQEGAAQDEQKSWPLRLLLSEVYLHDDPMRRRPRRCNALRGVPSAHAQRARPIPATQWRATEPCVLRAK